MEALGHAGETALWLALAVSLPVVGIAAIVGSLVAAFQAASQIQDPTLAHLPRLVAVGLGLILFGGWMAVEIAGFARRMFEMAAI